MTLPPEELDRLEALANAATVSPDVLKRNFQLGIQDVLTNQNLPAEDMAGLIEVIRDGSLDKISDAIVNCIEVIPKLIAEVRRLRGALEFYSNKNNWNEQLVEEGGHPYGPYAPPLIDTDNGETARKALEKNNV